MVRNNILSMIFQWIMSVLVLGFILWVYHMNLESTFYSQWLYRGIFIFIICCLYFIMGKLLKREIHPLKIIGSFILPIGLGFLFAFLGHLFVHDQALVSEVGAHLSLLPLDLYLLPQRMILTLLNQPQNSTYLLVEILLPSVFMFLSLLDGRVKMVRQKKRREKRKGDAYV